MSIFCRSGCVSHLCLGFGFEKFPLKMSNFSIVFPSGQKKSLQVGLKSTWVKSGLASHLLWVKSKSGLGQGPSLLRGQCDLYRKYKFVGDTKFN